ncbi:MAG TPA: ribonuclease III domain-containing protein [Defluviitaleaceae bacterium]|jgi:ribonuclease-3 family protein|nr:ribonuclease III [Candidatus Epulonipiscium sp.]HOA81751.1 ribonuclease III domain-containing protein [Defluviitaleaceae bacterium]
MEDQSITSKLLNTLNEQVKNNDVKPREYSPLVLAYIGDAVFEIFIRTAVVIKGNASVNKLNKTVREYVKASGQAEIYDKIKSYLTEEEESIFKRGRNAKSVTVPKNALLSDYKHATGLEALLGYLYLDGQIERLQYLIKLGIEKD